MPYFFKTINFYIIFLAFIFFIGCKSKNPNPEFLDPIFLDLQSKYKDFNKEADSLPKQIKAAKEELKDTGPRSTERIVAERALIKLEKQLSNVTQKARFYKIRMEKRRIHCKLAYDQAFQKDEVWPNPEENEFYMQNNRLRSANMNWNSRVPKLFKENPNYEDKK